jgi:hypothetical protein
MKMKLYQVPVFMTLLMALALTGAFASPAAVPAGGKAGMAKTCPMCAAKAAMPGAANDAAKGKGDKPIPDVKYPFSFACPHCTMKITIKTKDDWKKDCPNCACGVNQLGCYYDSLKTKKKN